MQRSVALSRREIALVISDLKRRRRYYNSRLNNIIFRLACCCGLRRKEIAGLEVDDVIIEGDQPCIRIRWQITKGGLRKVKQPDGTFKIKRKKARVIPLSLDSGTLADIAEWKRQQLHARIKKFATTKEGKPLSRRAVSARWRTAIRALGNERRKQITCHDGRRTFASVLAAAGAPTPNIKDLLGHENIQTTDNYLCSMDFTAIDLFGGAHG